MNAFTSNKRKEKQIDRVRPRRTEMRKQQNEKRKRANRTQPTANSQDYMYSECEVQLKKWKAHHTRNANGLCTRCAVRADSRKVVDEHRPVRFTVSGSVSVSATDTHLYASRHIRLPNHHHAALCSQLIIKTMRLHARQRED